MARRITAWLLIILYNCVAVSDILSTIVALDSGAGVEANPVVLAMMDHVGDGWMLAKLSLQGVVSFMVAWFPHWIVLGFFAVATLGNLWIVYNNLAIAGFF